MAVVDGSGRARRKYRSFGERINGSQAFQSLVLWGHADLSGRAQKDAEYVLRHPDRNVVVKCHRKTFGFAASCEPKGTPDATKRRSGHLKT